MNQFGLETPDIEASGAYDLLVQGMISRDLDHGKIQSQNPSGAALAKLEACKAKG
jgi:hypothetical protein